MSLQTGFYPVMFQTWWPKWSLKPAVMVSPAVTGTTTNLPSPLLHLDCHTLLLHC